MIKTKEFERLWAFSERFKKLPLEERKEMKAAFEEWWEAADMAMWPENEWLEGVSIDWFYCHDALRIMSLWIYWCPEYPCIRDNPNWPIEFCFEEQLIRFVPIFRKCEWQARGFTEDELHERDRLLSSMFYSHDPDVRKNVIDQGVHPGVKDLVEQALR